MVYLQAKSAPWSLDQMRKNACNWTLEGDDQILQMMKRIGKSVEDKCIATSDKLHQLSLNVGAVKVQLANVNNKLLILQNDHFIDHRVQEDEDYLVAPGGASNQPCDNTKAEQPPKLSFEEAGKVMIKQTIKALDECYEKVTLTVIDSEDEEEDEERRDNIVFRPKDPYKVRPLPYLIGSEKWRLKWHVGMHETDSEDSDQENAIKEEEYSDSMSDKSNSMSWPSNATPSENSNYGLQSQNFYGKVLFKILKTNFKNSTLNLFQITIHRRCWLMTYRSTRTGTLNLLISRVMYHPKKK